jgi:hypothetical protein
MTLTFPNIRQPRAGTAFIRGCTAKHAKSFACTLCASSHQPSSFGSGWSAGTHRDVQWKPPKAMNEALQTKNRLQRDILVAVDLTDDCMEGLEWLVENCCRQGVPRS